jgi:hypothetical protein
MRYVEAAPRCAHTMLILCPSATAILYQEHVLLEKLDPIREFQRVHTSEKPHTLDTHTASKIQRMHASESAHIPNPHTETKNQRAYAERPHP